MEDDALRQLHANSKIESALSGSRGRSRWTARRAEGSFTGRMNEEDDATALEGRQELSALWLAWRALLAQDQTNRNLAEACRDTARAMLHAMQAHCVHGARALQSDELHCWYNDALDFVKRCPAVS